jgi:hypothetical protein
VVTLSGIAWNAAEKCLLTKLVTDINGVTSVVNNLTIEIARNQILGPLPAGERIQGAPVGGGSNEKENHMLWTLVVVLLVLWALGLVTSYTMGGLIHVVLVVAVVMLLVNLFSGRKRA